MMMMMMMILITDDGRDFCSWAIVKTNSGDKHCEFSHFY